MLQLMDRSNFQGPSGLSQVYSLSSLGLNCPRAIEEDSHRDKAIIENGILLFSFCII
jgi:hypothetical protein